jgi:hypothetical protein
MQLGPWHKDFRCISIVRSSSLRALMEMLLIVLATWQVDTPPTALYHIVVILPDTATACSRDRMGSVRCARTVFYTVETFVSAKGSAW